MGLKPKRKAGGSPCQSTLPPGHADKVLERLLLSEKVIPPGDVPQVLHDTGCFDSRRCKLTFEVTCWVVLAMNVLIELPPRAVSQAARRLGKGDKTGCRSALRTARKRLGVAPPRRLFLRIARPLATPSTPGPSTRDSASWPPAPPS